MSKLPKLPPVIVVLGHIFTFSIFTYIWFGVVHGKLPKRREDDPSTARAILFLLIPVFNFYWAFFFWIRLWKRLNEGLSSKKKIDVRWLWTMLIVPLVGFAFIVFGLAFDAIYLAYAGLVVIYLVFPYLVGPAFVWRMQEGVNKYKMKGARFRVKK